MIEYWIVFLVPFSSSDALVLKTLISYLVGVSHYTPVARTDVCVD